MMRLTESATSLAMNTERSTHRRNTTFCQSLYLLVVGKCLLSLKKVFLVALVSRVVGLEDGTR